MDRNAPPAFKIITLGCKTNQSESDDIARELCAAGFINHGHLSGNSGTYPLKADSTGYKDADFKDSDYMDHIKSHAINPDYIIINTCTVTAATDSKVRQSIRAARKNAPEAIIIATGCFSIFNDRTLKELGADHVFANNRKGLIAGFIKDSLKNNKNNSLKEPGQPLAFHERSRAFVKIQDGCQQGCTYCIVPLVRGQYNSKKPAEIIDEINLLAGNGYEEIVLTGIHIGKYGVDFHGDGDTASNLTSLLGRIIESTQARRIRLSSIEINEIDSGLIDIICGSNRRIAGHLHIPLQSGSDSVLAAMNRKYDTAFFDKIILEIKNRMPSIALTTDIIAGFPGETNKDFEMTVDMILKTGFSKVHVFKYSPRAKTAAALMEGQIDEKVKKTRSRTAIELAEGLRKQFIAASIGRPQEVVYEEFDLKTQLASGTSENYIKTYFCIPHWHNYSFIKKGKILSVMADELYRDGLLGSIIYQ